MLNTQKFTINFQPVGKRVVTDPDQSILNAAQDAGIALASICGGVGICDSCRIRLINGSMSEPTIEEVALYSEDELRSGFRLACQSYPLSDLTIEIPPESLTAPQRLQIEGQSISIELDPIVMPVDLYIPEPTTSDLRADSKRIKDCLMELGLSHPINISYPILDSMSPLLRSYDWHTTAAIR